MEINVDKLLDVIVSKKLTLKELSEKSGISQVVLSRIIHKKNKRASIKTLIRLIDALDISLADLRG